MRFPVTWRPRPSPLEPAGLAARGAAARALAGRLLARGDEELARLAGVAGPELLILLGAPDDLPWVDGVSYLGRDPEAPLLLLPTALAPSVHPRLLQEALGARAAGSQKPETSETSETKTPFPFRVPAVPAVPEVPVFGFPPRRLLMARVDKGLAPPLAVLLNPDLLVSTAAARPIVRRVLQNAVESWRREA